jgi:alkaline phosphatase D
MSDLSPKPWFFVTSGSNRRSFLLATTSLAAAAVWSSRAMGVVKKNVKFSAQPFALGVASGDPSPDGFVIWTRLAPDPLVGGGMPAEDVEVSWQVSDDEGMTRVVAKGTTVAAFDWAHAVHVEVQGLRSDRWYFYQFQAGGEVSPVGRARTMPAVDSLPANLRFGVASCQHYEHGLFTAYEHMAKEELDLVAHLGDYIYEYAAKENVVRKHIGPEIKTLEDYRNRHAQYKTDAHLQAAHAACPWVVTWDDHEFDNNCAGQISEEQGVQPEKFLARRANAYRAYYEHMPLRRSSLPTGPDMIIYRRLAFGRLAEFSVLDTRQYRTDQPCGDGNKPQCEDALSSQATLLGNEQEAWLCDGLAKSTATWNVLAQQVMMARVDRIPGETVAYSMDQWPGYEMNRRRVLKFFDERTISNPVVLGGDIHSNWANDLIADFDDLDSKVVASEFVCTSISSGGDGKAVNPTTEGVLRENPFVKLYNSERGYVRCEVTPKLWRSDFRVVEKVTKPGAPRVDRASFVVEAGQAGVKPA